MRETLCFVVMPFRPELNYFFLYLKRYLEEKYRIRVERGDSNVLTKEILRKISEQISEASFLIADITGSNANVFFELGIAHERNKPVIFLTQDDPKDAPVDTRQFEFIKYELGRHEDFLAKLDNAVRNVLGSSLDIPQLYEFARDLLKQFNVESGFTHDQASREEFHARLVRAAETQGIPHFADSARLGPFLLPKILQDATDLDVMQRVTVWLEKRESASVIGRA
ncbi:MAG: hypothetical protein ACR2I2_19350 [Bryobacteraceae bacterium]